MAPSPLGRYDDGGFVMLTPAISASRRTCCGAGEPRQHPRARPAGQTPRRRAALRAALGLEAFRFSMARTLAQPKLQAISAGLKSRYQAGRRRAAAAVEKGGDDN